MVAQPIRIDHHGQKEEGPSLPDETPLPRSRKHFTILHHPCAGSDSSVSFFFLQSFFFLERSTAIALSPANIPGNLKPGLPWCPIRRPTHPTRNSFFSAG